VRVGGFGGFAPVVGAQIYAWVGGGGNGGSGCPTGCRSCRLSPASEEKRARAGGVHELIPHVGNPSFFSFSLAFAPTIMSPTLAIESKDGVTAHEAQPVRRPVLNGSNDSSDLDERELAKVGKKSVLRACSSSLQKTWQCLLTCRETLRF
jgi:hypothetical protein